ncbi:MAG TPA: 23S rRNA (pseudouridine(1915)-N(3))-methyltransferase RlmH [Steroidobacteraceae bacterium]|nr:23S rRNA (pseudouridine(1915)-N(3))-methyltransferase RlmH [Steroidobacteraceae bacterium]
MRIELLALGTRMPAWVDAGVDDYVRRFGPEIRFELREIPLARRTADANATRAIAAEGTRLLAALRKDTFVVALEVGGTTFGTEQLSTWLGQRMHAGRDLSFLIGGPDGLAPGCLRRSDLRWSLSALTLPHGLVRIVLVEQLYRALSLIKGHPYHRP